MHFASPAVGSRIAGHIRRLTVVVVATAALTSACASGGDSFDDRFSVVDGLAELPLLDIGIDDAIIIDMIDYRRASTAAGVPQLDSESTDDELNAWVMAATRGTPAVDGGTGLVLGQPQLFGSSGATPLQVLPEEFGWTFGAVDRFAEVSAAEQRFTTLAGDLDWRDGLAETGPGIESIGQGGDLELNLDDRSDVRPLGRPLRLGERSGLLAASLTSAPIERWVSGEHEAYSSDAEMLAIAEVLDENTVFRATLLRATFAIDRGIPLDIDPDAVGDVIDGALDQAFTTVGFGLNVVDGQLGHVIVYAFASEASAANAALQLDELWNTGVSLQSGSPFDDFVSEPVVTHSGRTVTVTGGVPDDQNTNVVYSIAVSGDLTFAHR